MYQAFFFSACFKLVPFLPAFHQTILFIHALPWTLLMQPCFVMPLDKDRADRFTAPLCSLFWFSKAHWFNKSVLFDAQGLNPPGEETRYVRGGGECSHFFWLLSDSFDFSALLRSAACSTVAATRSPTAVAAAPLLPLSAALAAFSLSWAPFRTRWRANEFDN